MVVTVHFGDARYRQYKDTTPLKIWNYLDHNDWERKQRYLARHRHDSGPAGALAKEFF